MEEKIRLIPHCRICANYLNKWLWGTGKPCGYGYCTLKKGEIKTDDFCNNFVLRQNDAEEKKDG